jgi:AraC-like DNA-binding protein
MHQPALASVSADLADPDGSGIFASALSRLHGRWGNIPDTILRLALGSGLRTATIKQACSALNCTRWELAHEMAALGLPRGSRVLSAGRLAVARELALSSNWTAHEIARYCGFADSRPLKTLTDSAAAGGVKEWRAAAASPEALDGEQTAFLARLDRFVAAKDQRNSY